MAKMKRPKRTLYVIILTLALASMFFRFFIIEERYEQTALLFVGLPALISLLMVRFTSKPQSSPYKSVFWVLTMFLLLACVAFGEGTICIVMAAPLFYAVAGAVVGVMQYLKNRDKYYLNSIIIIPLLILMAEGVPFKKVQESTNVSVEQIVDGNISLEKMNLQPDFIPNLPGILKIGFPKPIAVEGTGIEVGDARIIQFESSTKGVGKLHLRIKEKTEQRLVFEVVSDSSHIDQWIAWEEISIALEPMEDGKTKVEWSTKFRNKLSPRWYFEPIERLTVSVSSNYLIASYFDNQETN